MPAIIINSKLKEMVPGLELGVVRLDGITVSKSTDKLWRDLQALADGLIKSVSSMGQIAILPAVEATKRAYKSLGKDPSRYRGSAEALLRRILSGKGLYQINNVVDINNYISLISMCPVGSYDFSRIQGEIVFRAGGQGESYKGIGKDTVSLEGIPVFCDGLGPFGSPTSDSERTMIQGNTTSVVTIVISFGGLQEPMQKQMGKFAALYHEYLPACSVLTSVIT